MIHNSTEKYLSERTIIVIPARSGSKRLPHKNTLLIKGKPLFYYAIEVAKEALITPHIYVLSDDEAILTLAEGYGAIPFKLPLELAGDTTEVVKPSLYALKVLKETQNLDFADLICLQPTSPLRSTEDVVKSYLLFKEKEANSLISTSIVDPHFFHWAIEEKEGQGKFYFGSKFMKSRTELPAIYYPNGAIKIAKVPILQKQESFFGDAFELYQMPAERSLSIGERFEFELCKYIMEKKKA